MRCFTFLSPLYILPPGLCHPLMPLLLHSHHRDVGFLLSLQPPLHSSGSIIIIALVVIVALAFILPHPPSLPPSPSSSLTSSWCGGGPGPCSGVRSRQPLRLQRRLGNQLHEGFVQLVERLPRPPWETSSERATRGECRRICLRHVQGDGSYRGAAMTMYIIVFM